LFSSRVLRSHLRSRVIVTLKSGAAFDGVLVEADDRAWVLRDCTALGGSQSRPIPVDGEVIVLAQDVDYAQKP
jgi:small nuclear ribonucleoprotein (snRNP)-like protein